MAGVTRIVPDCAMFFLVINLNDLSKKVEGQKLSLTNENILTASSIQILISAYAKSKIVPLHKGKCVDLSPPTPKSTALPATNPNKAQTVEIVISFLAEFNYKDKFTVLLTTTRTPGHKSCKHILPDRVAFQLFICRIDKSSSQAEAGHPLERETLLESRAALEFRRSSSHNTGLRFTYLVGVRLSFNFAIAFLY